MKDKWSYLSVLIIFIGLSFVYAGVGSMEMETITNLKGVILSGVGFVIAVIGWTLLKINEL